MAFCGSEYNDWGIAAGCRASQGTRVFSREAPVAVSIVDYEIGLLAFKNLGGVVGRGGFQGFGALSLEQSSKDITGL